MTISPGITIRGTAGNIGTSIGTLINRGTIRRDSGAGQFQLLFGVNGRNEGAIETTVTSTAIASRTIISGGGSNTFTNAGTITTSGAITLGFQTTERWVNAGTVVSTGGTVELRGLITQANLGDFRRDAATTVNFAGTLTGGLTLDDTTGSWRCIGGEIQGDDPHFRVRPAHRDRHLRHPAGVTWKAGSTWPRRPPASPSKRIDPHTTLQVGDPAGATFTTVNVRGRTQTIGGTGTIQFGGHTSNTLTGFSITPSLTISAGVTIRGAGRITGMQTFENRGRSWPRAGKFIVVDNQFLNTGSVRAAGGAECIVRDTTAGRPNRTGLVANGSYNEVALTGGTWVAGAGSSIRFMNEGSSGTAFRITRLNAALTLDGPGSVIYGGGAGTIFDRYDALDELANVEAEGALTVTGGRALVLHKNLTTAGTVTVAPGSQLLLSDGLVGRWLADGNATDATGRANGVPSTGLTYVAGVNGQASSFGGRARANWWTSRSRRWSGPRRSPSPFGSSRPRPSRRVGRRCSPT